MQKHISVGSFRTTERMRTLINEVLDSNRISYGKKSLAFEREFAHLHDCEYGILSNSGTSSLGIAVQALKIAEGWDSHTQILVPATTFVATMNVVIHNGLVPIVVDVEPETLGINSGQAERSITDRTRAIIPVHVGGQPCYMREIQELAKQYNLKIIEDSCEAMFVEHDGQKVGSMSDIGCFSMYVAHLLTTGIGGIATTNSPEYASLMRSLVNHGLSIENLNPDSNFAPQPMLNRRFVFTHVGKSYRITELEAALGLAQLEIETIEDMLDSRRTHAHWLTQSLSGLEAELLLPRVAKGNTSAWMFYYLMTRNEPKENLMRHLNDAGIETRDIPSLLGQPCYPWLMATVSDYPVSKFIAEHGFYVGCHEHLTLDDMDYIADTIKAYFKHETQPQMVKA